MFDSNSLGHCTARANHLASVPYTRQHRLLMSLVGDERDVLRVRKAVIQFGNGEVKIVRCAPIRNSTKARLTIELQAGALDATLHHNMQSIESGEFGRIRFSP